MSFAQNSLQGPGDTSRATWLMGDNTQLFRQGHSRKLKTGTYNWLNIVKLVEPPTFEHCRTTNSGIMPNRLAKSLILRKQTEKKAYKWVVTEHSHFKCLMLSFSPIFCSITCQFMLEVIF